MSRALGAAFLNHQVEQLERTVHSNNWRDRGRGRDVPVPGRERGAPSITGYKSRATTGAYAKGGGRRREEYDNKETGARRSRSEEVRANDAGDQLKKEGEKQKQKDADVVIVDASVLVHALYQVKKWCRDGREEIVIVPLEGLWFLSPLLSILTKIN